MKDANDEVQRTPSKKKFEHMWDPDASETNSYETKKARSKRHGDTEIVERRKSKWKPKL